MILGFRILSRIILLFFVISCEKPVDPNAVFNKKYGQQILQKRQENAQLIDQQAKSQQQKKSFNALDPNSPDYARSYDSNFAHSDISKFGQKYSKHHLPNGETYQQLRARNPSNSLPKDIFEITYNRVGYKSFKKNNQEFDNIAIPKNDAYGVTTNLAKKPYLLVGNNVLQNTVDHMRSSRNKYDVENSKIIITEQKKLRRQQKMIKIFGNSNFLDQDLSNKEPITKESKENAKNSDEIATNKAQSQPSKIIVAQQ